jgi:hypothetical protein
MVILTAAAVKQMTDVVPYPYRQDADYLYYTGCNQPEGIAVLDDHADLCMFMPDRDPEVSQCSVQERESWLVGGFRRLGALAFYWSFLLWFW